MKKHLVLGLFVATMACACAKSPSGGGSESSSSSSSSGGAATTCPSDPQAAIGKSCSPDGTMCGTSPSGFTHFIMCQRGKWAEMEAPPPPPPPAPTSS